MPWDETGRRVYRPAVLRGWALIGLAVRRRRLALALSQRDLQRRSGVSQSLISRLENGVLRGMRWSRFAQLVDALDGLDFPTPPTNHWMALDQRHALLDAEDSEWRPLPGRGR
ncbi:MAG: helix-turn-helix domain-containing protein [Chloroflexota bacterium]